MVAEGGAPQRKPFFVRTGDPRFVILRTSGTKNLVLVFDLSTHDSRLTAFLTTVVAEGGAPQRKPFFVRTGDLRFVILNPKGEESGFGV